MAEGSAGSDLRIVVVFSPAPREVIEQALVLPHGSKVVDALHAAGLHARALADGVSIGVWGRRAGLEHVLRDADRVELYRGLRVDPKTARRERFNRQGARSAGLFAKRRPGAKAGY